MTMNEVWFLKASAADLQNALTSGDLTSVDLVKQCLAQISRYDRQGPTLRAMISESPTAISTAERLDEERARGNTRGPFHGIPIIIKVRTASAD